MANPKKTPKKQTKKTAASTPRPGLQKAPTGIAGLDTITGGGLPRGRPTLVCGSAGSGKTLFGLQFLINGAERGEPGVIIAFEESAEDLAKNVASLGVDLDLLVRRKKIAIDAIRVDRGEILETGATISPVSSSGSSTPSRRSAPDASSSTRWKCSSPASRTRA